MWGITAEKMKTSWYLLPMINLKLLIKNQLGPGQKEKNSKKFGYFNPERTSFSPSTEV